MSETAKDQDSNGGCTETRGCSELCPISDWSSRQRLSSLVLHQWAPGVSPPNHREELLERPIPQDAESQLAEHGHSLKYLKGIVSHQVAPGPQLSPSHPSELLPFISMGVAYAFCNSPLISVCPWMTWRGLCLFSAWHKSRGRVQVSSLRDWNQRLPRISTEFRKSWNIFLKQNHWGMIWGEDGSGGVRWSGSTGVCVS